jgi:hypothetical protein
LGKITSMTSAVTAPWLPEPVRLASAAECVDRLPVTLPQVNALGDAGVLGVRYTGRLGTAYGADQVAAWASAPVLGPADLAYILPSHTSLAAIIRHSPPTEARPDDPSGRTWYGCHLAAANHPDPAIRAQQADASRMWWRVSHARLDQIRAITAGGGTVPLVCTVAKAVVTGFHITGIDNLTYPGSGTTAFTVTDPGPWLDDLAERWLNAGQGASIIWWDRQSTEH